MIKVDIERVNTDERYRKALALIKWRKIVKSDGYMEGFYCDDFYDEFTKLKGYCSYCEFYYKYSSRCSGCPLIVKGESCGRGGHPYRIWNGSSTRENAQAVLDLIKSVKVPSKNEQTVLNLIKKVIVHKGIKNG